MSATTELNSARNDLSEVLGENLKLYLQILKSWFKQKINRDEFDHEARKLLPHDSVHLHNQFLLAILTKCQAIGTALVQRDQNVAAQTAPSAQPKQKKQKDKNKKRTQCPRVTFHQRFLEASPLHQVPCVQPYIPESTDCRPAYISREMLLPHISLIHGRMIVSAWDYGLDDVEDDAVRLLLQAVETQLKNVITAVLCRRNGYHLREKRFRHGFGSECAPSFLQNSSFIRSDSHDSEIYPLASAKGYGRLSVTTSEGVCDEAAQIASGGAIPPTKGHINVFDFYDALKIHKSALPSHSVYAIAMERISNRLHHSSQEEDTQEELHRQEVQLKREIHAQQAVFRT